MSTSFSLNVTKWFQPHGSSTIFPSATHFLLDLQMGRGWWLGVRDAFILVFCWFSSNSQISNIISNFEEWFLSVNHLSSQ
jgi:hypothetical protein